MKRKGNAANPARFLRPPAICCEKICRLPHREWRAVRSPKRNACRQRLQRLEVGASLAFILARVAAWARNIIRRRGSNPVRWPAIPKSSKADVSLAASMHRRVCWRGSWNLVHSGARKGDTCPWCQSKFGAGAGRPQRRVFVQGQITRRAPGREGVERALRVRRIISALDQSVTFQGYCTPQDSRNVFSLARMLPKMPLGRKMMKTTSSTP